jgi:hypothetical protein
MPLLPAQPVQAVPMTGALRLAPFFLIVACASRVPAVITPDTGAFIGGAHSQMVTPLTSGDPARGRQAFIDLRCHACHSVAAGDSLPAIEGRWKDPLPLNLGAESPEGVAWRIVTRTRLAPESLFESAMVESASAMTERQLVDLIAYLRDPAGGRVETR